MADGLLFPFGVYDTKQFRMRFIGLHTDEADCWCVYLGWPDAEEIADAKARGLKVLPLTLTYDPAL